jgi:hypothetical protein
MNCLQKQSHYLHLAMQVKMGRLHSGPLGGKSQNSGSRTKNRKNRKNSTKIDFFLNFSFDKFSLKLIENTTKMTLGYLDIA